MKLSKIGWCDFSGGDLNFVTGCTPRSEGCRECYGRRIYERFGRDFSKVTLHPDKLRRLERKRFPMYSLKRGAPHKPMCFPVDTGDLFHEKVPTDFIAWAFDVMSYRKDIEWLVLTKRPKRMNSVLFGEEGNYYLGGGDWYSNIRLMVSVENQRWADERIPELLKEWQGPNGVSVEPMLEGIDLHLIRHEPCSHPGCFSHVSHPCEGCGYQAGKLPLHWVICGAESGPKRRPFSLKAAEDLYDQCTAAGLPFFGKQASGLRPGVPLLIRGNEVHQWPESRKTIPLR